MSNQKCTKTSMCKGLENLLATKQNAAGLHVLMTGGFRGGDEEIFQGVYLKRTAADNGMMLNYCPMCGAQPGAFKRPEEKKESSEG